MSRHSWLQTDVSTLTPPLGIPDPTYSPFHQPIFEHLRDLAPDCVKNG